MEGYYLDFQFQVVLHVHHTFYPQQGVQILEKQHFSVKKASKIRFCAAVSHLVVVISTFKVLLKIF